MVLLFQILLYNKNSVCIFVYFGVYQLGNSWLSETLHQRLLHGSGLLFQITVYCKRQFKRNSNTKMTGAENENEHMDAINYRHVKGEGGTN